MDLVRLYIKDFCCYDCAYIDFTLFNAALLVGKKENNDEYSNGVGKSTIFQSIEYALFNFSDANLEDIIRDDTQECKITLDFEEGSQLYRLTRMRTRKGASDLTLYKRTGNDGTPEESLHIVKNNVLVPKSEEKYWEDISGRRTSDTEKELNKILKSNLKLFRTCVHFVQHDFSGLTTETPDKRKGILRNALNLDSYLRYEKATKVKCNSLVKEVEHLNAVTETLGNPDADLVKLAIQLDNINTDIEVKTNTLNFLEETKSNIKSNINNLHDAISDFENKCASLLSKEKALTDEKNKVENSVKEYTTKTFNVNKFIAELKVDLSTKLENQKTLSAIDFNEIDVLDDQILSNKERIAQLDLIIKNDTDRIKKLKIPMPQDGVCEHCRQALSDEHRKICQTEIDKEIKEKESNIQACKAKSKELSDENISHNKTITRHSTSKQYLSDITSQIATKTKELEDKNELKREYTSNYNKFVNELSLKTKEFELVQLDLKAASADELKVLQSKIEVEKQNLNKINGEMLVLNKEINVSGNNKAVIENKIEQANSNKAKQLVNQSLIKELNHKISKYPSVIQAYSNTGIPNLIIQNMLDDLQIEANKILEQLRPGLQLSFAVEKIKQDGTISDTLDIFYTVNGQKRCYEKISGAMKLEVAFSLKLGLSFLLQKMMGVDIKFLLLDELDPALDKAGVDAFANIVRYFQNEYKILVITHNDRLKDKFSHAILVEQDINMVSQAKVVSSW